MARTEPGTQAHGSSSAAFRGHQLWGGSEVKQPEFEQHPYVMLALQVATLHYAALLAPV